MNKNINIAIVGLGQIGNYLYNELNVKKKRYREKNWKKNQNCCHLSKKHK